jgi:IS30 family transposase
MRAQDVGVREIARRLGRSASTISRELRRNAATRGGTLQYRASTAQWKAERQAQRPKPAKLAINEQLHTYVQHRLAGWVEAPDGQTVPGPDVAWGGRRHGRRKNRRWATAWSPEQIARRLPVDFPEDESMRISHEAIYQGLYVQARGGLRRELPACLRTGRTLRKPRARTKRGKHFVSPEIKIDQRPQEAADRTVAGHWEGDLILGLGGTAIGTLVERATRFTMLLHLPPMHGWCQPAAQERSSAGRARRRSGARRDRLHDYRLARRAAPLPRAPWEQGAEMAQHAHLSETTGLPVYFCDPHSPWQRPSNENTNGLLRQYFPKGTNLSRHSHEDLDAVATALNNRPRKTHDWHTATEMLNDQLTLQQHPGVASTG